MDIFSVGQATIKSGCDTLATDEIVAVGEVEENTTHDAEFIFFDHAGALTPDLTIELKHPPVSNGNDDPNWKMTFALKALMGDHRLYDCALSFANFHFIDEQRSSGALPFTVQVNRWRQWQNLDENRTLDFWQIALQPGYESHYYDYFDLISMDIRGSLLHRKVATCAESNTGWKVVGAAGRPLVFHKPLSIHSLSTQPGNLYIFAINNAELVYLDSWQGEDPSKRQWMWLNPHSLPVNNLGLYDPVASPMPVPLSVQSYVVAIRSSDFAGHIDLYLSGADGNFHSVSAWYPGLTKYWRKIVAHGVFTSLPGSLFQVSGNHLFALDDQKHLWVGRLESNDVDIAPLWVQITGHSVKINSFSIAQKGTLVTLLLNTENGEIYAAPFTSADHPVMWERVGATVNFLAFPQAEIAWAVPREGHLDIFTTGQDGKIYSTYWEAGQGWETNHNWFQIEPNSQTFTTPFQANLTALNRVKNQLEILTQGADQKIWKTWWT